ncbi:hypothetical protein EW146_g7208 [Bondarzewia mesenterica]|uniref:Derlin n=1 Tax=Bondarzewia mesenterica TaxID=1095465 RepID=A0A4S4LN90_9AGAM|nr:hypothetical protein EW146_g7208 [Bondarzewia mesenterica]
MPYTGFFDEIRKIPPVTRFLCSGINYIFDIIMLYRNSDALESGNYSGHSPDYAWQLILAAGAILGLNIPLRTFIHTRALLLCTTYLSSALSPEGMQTSFMGLITFPVKYFPYVLLGMDLIMGGPSAAAVSVTGLVVGHLWWWTMYGDDGRGIPGVREWGIAPTWLRSFISNGAGPNPGAGSGVHVIPPRQRREERTRIIGYQWGAGQPLGTE